MPSSGYILDYGEHPPSTKLASEQQWLSHTNLNTRPPLLFLLLGLCLLALLHCCSHRSTTKSYRWEEE